MFKHDKKDKKYRLVITRLADRTAYKYKVYYGDQCVSTDTSFSRGNAKYWGLIAIRHHKRQLQGDQVVFDKKYV